jgi:tetratricopeptide (TPR) repeat protein
MEDTLKIRWAKTFVIPLIVLTANPAFAIFPPTLAPINKVSLPPANAAPDESVPEDFYTSALRQLTQRVKNKPNAQNYLDRARIYALKSDFNAAIKDLNKVISLKGDVVDAHKLRAYCYGALNKQKNAQSDYVCYLQMRPKDVPVWIALGASYDRDNQPDKAIDAFSRAIVLKPKESSFYAFRADVYGRAGKFDKAALSINEGLKYDPKSRSCLYERAYLKELRKDRAGALQEFDRLIKQFPDFMQARKERASIYEEKGDYEKALADYDKLVEIVSDSTSKILEKAVRKAQAADALGGAMEMTEALEFYPEKIYFLRKRSEAYRSLHKYAEAMNDADYAIALAPGDALAVLQRGYVEFSMDHSADAIADFKKVLQIDPEEDTAYWGLGFSLCLIGDYAAAAADFDKYSKTKNPDPYVKYCYVYRALMLKLSSQLSVLPSLYATADTKLKHNEWPYPFLDYLNGKITLSQLNATADNNDKKTELHCFLGLDALSEKNRDRAKEEFNWVIENGNKEFFEYTLSQSLLKGLN